MLDFNVDKESFPNSFKQAGISPVVPEKDDTNDKNNYRPVNILPSLFKAFEKCLYDQICVYIDSIPFKAQCGFRKGCRTRYLIINIQDGICGLLFTDLKVH